MITTHFTTLNKVREYVPVSSLSDAFLQDRQGELQRYIDRLLAAAPLACAPAVQSFFFGASEDAEGAGT